MTDYSNKTILITGGTGYLGGALVKQLKAKKIIIFSRDETKQENMQKLYPYCEYVLGDVRDAGSITDACRGVDIVIHAAAVKYLDMAEVQPMECVRTNIIGSKNVIDACLANNVDICVACSTDKAPYARNVYGCSKQIMEALLREANKYNKTKFVYTRYGNVINSTGSVIPKWKKAIEEGQDIYVTGTDMKRFFMTVEHAVACVTEALDKRDNYIPNDLKAVYMQDVASWMADGKVDVKRMKRRPGERNFEILVADYEGTQYDTNTAEEFQKEEFLKLI